MLEAHVGSWRGRSSHYLVDNVALSIAANKTIKLTINSRTRMRLRGFPSRRGQRVQLQFQGERDDDQLVVDLATGVQGVLRSQISGRLGGVPIREEVRLHKRSST